MKADHRAQPGWGDAVPQHADPGIDLADLFPPVVIDDEIGGGGDQPKAERQQHAERDQRPEACGAGEGLLADAIPGSPGSEGHGLGGIMGTPTLLDTGR